MEINFLISFIIFNIFLFTLLSLHFFVFELYIISFTK